MGAVAPEPDPELVQTSTGTGSDLFTMFGPEVSPAPEPEVRILVNVCSVSDQVFPTLSHNFIACIRLMLQLLGGLPAL